MPQRDLGESSLRLTYDDFVLFPDDGMRHELIDGEHYVAPSPNLRHQEVSGRIYLLIGSWLETHPIGRLFYAPVDVLLSRFDVVVPDLLFMSNERARRIMMEKIVDGAPELVIEIGSPTTRKRDETIKLRLYERVGVVEYWIVNSSADTVRVYRRRAAKFMEPVELSRRTKDTLHTELLPGLELPLERVFRRG